MITLGEIQVLQTRLREAKHEMDRGAGDCDKCQRRLAPRGLARHADALEDAIRALDEMAKAAV